VLSIIWMSLSCATVMDEELRAYVNGEKLPPKGETKH
jgi:hypothetical protein